MKKLFTTCILTSIFCFCFAVNISAATLTGTITAEDNTPVIGATVMVEGTSNGAITDLDGKYYIKNLDKGVTLIYSYIGYATQSVIYNDQTNLNIQMVSDATEIDDIVVVGFGSQKKVNLTGSVAVVDQELLQDRPVSNVAEMLQGAVPGLNISNSAGTDMDAEASINIRGAGTIGAGSKGDPLILIDGMEGDFNSLNPQDVESISVLKDAASSSIYGSRAPFGVILITTKKGKSEKVTVNYNNNFRFSTPRNQPKMMDSYTFANFINDGQLNAGRGVWFGNGTVPTVDDILAYQKGEIKNGLLPSNVNPELWGDGFSYGISNTDHYDDAYVDWSFGQEHNVSINGGTDKVNLYMSANYSRQDGFIEVNPDNTERFTSTIKANAELLDWLTVNTTTRFSNKVYNYPTNLKRQKYTWANNQPEFFSGLGQWPTSPNYDPNGNLYSSVQRGVGDAIFSLAGGDAQDRNRQMYQQVSFTIEPIKGWKTFVDYNFRLRDTETTQELKKTYDVAVDNKTLVPICTDSYVSEFRYSGIYNNVNIYSEYSKTVNEKHSFKGMVGFQSESEYFGDVTAKRDGIIVDGLVSIDTTNGLSSTGALSPATVAGKYNNWSTAGFFGRINYSYDDRYLFEASLRYDGTSRFKGDYQWGYFPSGSIGWNIARESFFEPLADKIGTLKLRASYGQLGNQNTGNLYPTYRVMDIKTSSGTYLINHACPTTTTEPALIDPTLTWERISNWDIGLDVAAFENRLSITADYFVRKTTDMVGPAPEMPAYLGIAVPKQNNTDLSSKGYEVSISWRDNLQSGFSYGVSATLSDAVTTIDSYPNPTQSLTTYISGREIGDIWGYETVGIAKSKEEMNNHLAHTEQSTIGGGWDAGDIMYKDLDGNGKINKGANTLANHGDLKVVGNNTPRYALAFQFDASYKGFDVKAFFQGVMKRDYWLGESNKGGQFFWGYTKSMWNVAPYVEHADYFREDPNHLLGQNLDAYFPRPVFTPNGSTKNQQAQSRYIVDASYLRLKNFQLGYTIPRDITKKAGINSCRIFVSGENLFTFTDLAETYDPETLGGGYFGSSYPLAKTISAGLNVTF